MRNLVSSQVPRIQKTEETHFLKKSQLKKDGMMLDVLQTIKENAPSDKLEAAMKDCLAAWSTYKRIRACQDPNQDEESISSSSSDDGDAMTKVLESFITKTEDLDYLDQE